MAVKKIIKLLNGAVEFINSDDLKSVFSIVKHFLTEL